MCNHRGTQFRKMNYFFLIKEEKNISYINFTIIKAQKTNEKATYIEEVKIEDTN